MTEFNLKKEREEWFSKWLQKRLTGRAIIELKKQDEEFIRLLKKLLGDVWYMDCVKDEIDKLSGGLGECV